MFEPEQIKRYERETRAMIFRAANDDPEAFAAVVAILDDAIRTMLPAAAAALREQRGGGTPGYSWADLGRALGVSRQAAAKRFGRA